LPVELQGNRETIIHHQLLDGRVFVHLRLVLFVPGPIIRLRMP
jgi:allantoicase